MHHAAYMSVGKTVAVVVVVWVWSALLATLPLLGVGSYSYREYRFHCSFHWSYLEGPSHKVYVILVAILCFIVPGLVISAMYIGIFQVARQAAVQVRPLSASTLRAGSVSVSHRSAAPTTASTILSSKKNDRKPCNGHTGHTLSDTLDQIFVTTVGVLGAPTQASAAFGQSRQPSADSGRSSQSLSANGDGSRRPILRKISERESTGGASEQPAPRVYVTSCCKGGVGRPGRGEDRPAGSREDSGIASQSSAQSRPPVPPVLVEEPAMLRVNMSRPLQSHFKAAKTLLLLLAAYVVLWGPYFGLHIYGTIHGDVQNPGTTELAALWLGFTSFAVNPFLYGWMNKAIREELVSLYHRMFCGWACCFRCPWKHQRQASLEDELLQGPASGEDFFQFLERTSVVPPASVYANGGGLRRSSSTSASNSKNSSSNNKCKNTKQQQQQQQQEKPAECCESKSPVAEQIDIGPEMSNQDYSSDPF